MVFHLNVIELCCDFSRMDHYALSATPLHHRMVLIAVFCQAGPPQLARMLGPR